MWLWARNKVVCILGGCGLALRVRAPLLTCTCRPFTDNPSLQSQFSVWDRVSIQQVCGGTHMHTQVDSSELLHYDIRTCPFLGPCGKSPKRTFLSNRITGYDPPLPCFLSGCVWSLKPPLFRASGPLTPPQSV